MKLRFGKNEQLLILISCVTDEMKVSSLTSKSLSPRNVFNDFLPDVHQSHPQDSTVVSNVKDTEDVYVSFKKKE